MNFENYVRREKKYHESLYELFSDSFLHINSHLAL